MSASGWLLLLVKRFGDDGRKHDSYQLFARFTDGAHLSAAKGESLARSQNRRGCQESQPVSGCEQANLELDRENLGAPFGARVIAA